MNDPIISGVGRSTLHSSNENEGFREQDLAELQLEIQIGIDQADRGMTTPLTKELVQNIKAQG